MFESPPFGFFKPNARYVPVSPLDSDVDKTFSERLEEQRQGPSREWFKNGIILLLTIAVLGLSILNLKLWSWRDLLVSSQRTDSYISGIEDATYMPFKYITQYSPEKVEDLDQVEAAWAALRPTIGIVAVSHDWADRQGLPRADNLQNDASKGVYTIEGYHSLHCLIIIRHSMFQLARGEPLDVPFGHSMHCFDGLRQSIICQANDQLLYTRAGVADGEDQPRKCRSWESLRTWASQNSACYVGSHIGVAYENQTGCDERLAMGDGMILSP